MGLINFAQATTHLSLSASILREKYPDVVEYFMLQLGCQEAKIEERMVNLKIRNIR